MHSVAAQKIESDVRELSLADQLWLMERLAQHIRKQADSDPAAELRVLTEMAEDLDVRRELNRIQAESTLDDSRKDVA